jgi:lysozyme
VRTGSFRRGLRVAIPVLILLVAAGIAGWTFVHRWRPSLADFPIQGVDVSEEQGPIEWWTVKKTGIRFAYIRATAGTDKRDLRFPENWRWTYEAGIHRGAIHVYSLCRLALDQAGNFVSTVPRSQDQLPAAIQLDFQPDCDAQPERHVVIGELEKLSAAIESHLGKAPVLMVSDAFERKYRVSEALPRLLWSQGAFFPPSYFSRPWTMWQATRYVHVDGIETAVHWDVMAK